MRNPNINCLLKLGKDEDKRDLRHRKNEEKKHLMYPWRETLCLLMLFSCNTREKHAASCNIKGHMYWEIETSITRHAAGLQCLIWAKILHCWNWLLMSNAAEKLKLQQPTSPGWHTANPAKRLPRLCCLAHGKSGSDLWKQNVKCLALWKLKERVNRTQIKLQG